MIESLAKIGLKKDGSICRIALTAEDKAGRDLVTSWMQDLGLEVKIDAIGNIFGIRAGSEDLAPVMTGSHIDTVATGGKYDGAYGVLGGLEVAAALNDANAPTKRPLVVAVFTNEEGVRFTPDMMGSLVHAGGLDLKAALAASDDAGISLKTALEATGYAGQEPIGGIIPAAYVELHIEQGPVLEATGTIIGVVENLAGISWQEITIVGQANHAGTTPMDLRADAALAAARIIMFIHDLALKFGPGQRATAGSLTLEPGLVNVIPGSARLTVDLRNPDNQALKEAEAALAEFLVTLQKDSGISISTRSLVRFDPVGFDRGIANVIEKSARGLNLSTKRMTSGAGHDAQMIARIAPAAMIFVPSRGGISHNGLEDTEELHLIAGARVLLQTLLDLADQPDGKQ